MTQDSEFKKIVRERMAITGEKYIVALRVVLAAAREAIPQPDPIMRTRADETGPPDV